MVYIISIPTPTGPLPTPYMAISKGLKPTYEKRGTQRGAIRDTILGITK